MLSRLPSRLFARTSVGDIVRSAYNLLTPAGQIGNTIKLTSARTINLTYGNTIKSAFSTQPYDNEAAVKAFQNAVSTLLYLFILVLLTGNYHPFCSSSRASRLTTNLLPL